MEAAAPYVSSQAGQEPVVCFAHATNQMGRVKVDFEKGEDDGSQEALQVIAWTAKAWLRQREQQQTSGRPEQSA
jgi:uridine phosphorylase